MPESTTFNTTAGQTIARKLLMAFLNTGTSSAPVWSIVGKRVEDSSQEYDWNKETTQDILGNTFTTMSAPTITQTFDPCNLDAGETALTKLWQLAIKDQDVAALAEQDMMIVHCYAGTKDTAMFAERYSGCAIEVKSLGGDKTVDMPFDVTTAARARSAQRPSPTAWPRSRRRRHKGGDGVSNNISFETGLKAFTINGDANRKIYFDPNDIGIIDRLEAAAMAIKAKADEMGTQESDTDARTTIRELDAYAREQVDAAFPSPVCDTVFGKAYCVSLTPSGSLQIISFLEAVSRQIRREMDAATAAAQKRQAKYLDKYSGGQRRKKRRS